MLSRIMRFLSCHKDDIVKQLLLLTLATLCLAAPASAQIPSFQHVILVIQENRTPDNLFQGLCTTPTACSTKPSAGQYNIQTMGWYDKTSSTLTTNPTAVPFGLGWDMLHAHAAFVTECDIDMYGACAMDGAAHAHCLSYSQPCPTKAAYSYVDPGAVQPYVDIAKTYGWANYMFQTNQGPSFSAHQFLFGATSAPSAADDHSGLFVAGEGTVVGCNSPPTTVVPVINPQGVEFTRVYPCFDHQTMADLLEAKGVTWRYYGSTVGTYRGPNPDGIWMAPNSISRICVPVNQKCTGAEWTANLVFTPSAVLSDVSTPNCNLQGVSWVIPDSYDSDHSGTPKNVDGPSWVASIVNAVGNSPCTNKDGSSYWSSTAIIIVWDDWGGFYDHESPTIEPFPQGGFQMGFRVPMLVVSAYTGPASIGNSREDFGSVMRFIERNFGIMEGALTFADARGGTSDLGEYFSLGQPARPFQAINAPLSAKHFLTKKPSGLPVDND